MCNYLILIFINLLTFLCCCSVVAIVAAVAVAVTAAKVKGIAVVVVGGVVCYIPVSICIHVFKKKNPLHFPTFNFSLTNVFC